MSLLLRDEIRIFLSPDSVRIMHRQRHWRPVVVDKTIISCINKYGKAWTSPISILTELIQQEPWNKGDVTVILSNHFTRYLIVPWSELLLKKDEQRIYLSHLFNEIYGNHSSHFELRCSPEEFGKPQMACAIDREFIQCIKDSLSSSPQLKLKSIKPYLMTIYNSNYPQICNQDGWIVIFESGRICITGRGEGKWQYTKNTRMNLDSLNLEALLSRAQLSNHTESIPNNVFLWAPEHTKLQQMKNNWPMTQLTPKQCKGFSPKNDFCYSMLVND